MRIGYILILKEAKYFENLVNELSNIKNSNPIWVGVVIDVPEYYEQIISILNTFGCDFNVVYNLKNDEDIYKLDLFHKYKNGWTIVKIAGEETVANKDLLNRYILDGNKAAIIKTNKESINDMCFFNFIFKYLNGNKYEINEETDEVIFKTFEEKVLEKDPNMITTWEKLNEIYSNTTNI